MTAIAPVERLGNLGYAALGKETTPGVAVTPSVFVPLYKSTIDTDTKLDLDNPIMGVRSDPFNAFMGMRSHTGNIDVLAEPNTAKYLFDMVLSGGNVSGSGDPYTWPFTEGLSNSYTLDILKGQLVERYFGVQAEDIEPSFDKNKMKFTLNISARGSLLSRKIASVSTTTITLDTTYDPNPTTGFVASDVIRIMKSDLSTVFDTTITSITDGITLVIGDSAAAYAAGDYVFLRAQTPSYSILTPFEWARTEFRFGSTVSAALSATHTPQETGAKWKITNKFENKDGSQRSGSYDPASIVRLQTSAEVTLKQFFDQPANLQQFQDVSATSLIIRHFSGTNHELRLTFDSLKYKVDKRDIESAKIIYADITGTPVYNSSNGEAFSVKVINALAS